MLKSRDPFAFHLKFKVQLNISTLKNLKLQSEIVNHMSNFNLYIMQAPLYAYLPRSGCENKYQLRKMLLWALQQLRMQQKVDTFMSVN